MVHVSLNRQGMSVSQWNVLLSDKKYVCVCMCVCQRLSSLSPVSPSFLHACRKDSPVKDMAERVHLSLSLSPPCFLTLSPSPSIAESLSLSLPCEHRPPLRATKSSLLSSQAREPLSPSPSPERRPQDTNRTWHPERGWRWRRKRRRRRKMYSLRSSYPTVLSLCFFSLGRPTAAEWWGRDAHWHRVCDTRWLMVKTFEEGYDLNSVIYVIIP